MDEIRELEQTITALEARRNTLGDALVDATLSTLREKLASLRQRQAQEERKLVTVLFSDLVDSTALAERLDSEDMREILKGYLQRWAECIERRGGVVEKFIGDAVMAVFGLTTVQEDDPQRAIASAMQMLGELEYLNQEFEQTFHTRLAIRTGIHTGPVLVSTLAERGGRDFVAVGDTVNLASRLQNAAPENGILISHETYRQVQGLFEVMPLGAINLKGITQPVQIYQVVGERGGSGHAIRGIEGITTQLVGRQAEFARLQCIYRTCSRESQSWLVTITGDPGIGKTRLAGEFESWLSDQPGELIKLKADASRQSADTPFWLLHNAFSAWCGILGSDSIDTARAKLECYLVPYFAQGKGAKSSEMKAHFVGSLLGFDFSASPHLRGVRNDLTQLRKRALRYLAELFSLLAERAFIFVLLDDIHWSDKASLEAIQFVAESQPALRLMVVCLARQRLGDVHPEWRLRQQGAVYVTEWMRLKPLSKSASVQLFREIMHKACKTPKMLADKVVEAAEGNAFYLEEIIKMLIDERVIQVETTNGAWQVDKQQIQALSVPVTLTAAIQARLDSLRPAERNTLQEASIIGTTFWDWLLRTLVEYGDSVDEHLVTLQHRSMVHSKAHSIFEQANEYAFNQSLVRDVVYETILRKKRKVSHGKVAAWLAITAENSGRTGESAALVAQHYSQAGLSEMAAVWFLRAGKHAHSQGALVEARRFLDLACELLPDENLGLRWETLLERDLLLGELGDLQARRSDDEALLALAHELDDDRILALAYRAIASTHSNSGEFHQALKALDAALEAALRCGHQGVETFVYSFKIACLVQLGEIEQAGRLAETALEKAEALGDELELARTLTHLGMYYSATGDLPAAARMDQRMVLICHLIGEQVGEVVGMNNLGFNLLRLGRYEQAQEVLERAYRLSKAIGSQRMVAFTRMNLGLAAQFMGRMKAARSRLVVSIEEMRTIGDNFGHAVGLSYLARVLEDERRWTEAMAALSQAIEIFQQQSMPTYIIDARSCLARCLLNQGDQAGANQVAAQVWAYLSGNPPQALEFPLEAYLTCAEIFRYGGEVDLARASIQAAHGQLESMAEKMSDPDWQDAFKTQVPTHLRIEDLWKAMFAPADE